ncbi:MAG: hypothetical protein KY445_11285 [Armatimonadetes bacterium]|nr:hypothetical protein [Armatimonadota bacterium]
MEKKNRYTCKSCGGSIITIDRDEGVTPMFLRCRATSGCRGEMVSSMYRGVTGTPTFEWRKPTEVEYSRMQPEMKQHIDMGGLDIYPIQGNVTDRPKITRDITFGEDKSTLGHSLIGDNPRADELEAFVVDCVKKNMGLEAIITALNERGDLTDNEWTATIFGLGHYCARIGR